MPITVLTFSTCECDDMTSTAHAEPPPKERCETVKRSSSRSRAHDTITYNRLRESRQLPVLRGVELLACFGFDEVSEQPAVGAHHRSHLR